MADDRQYITTSEAAGELGYTVQHTRLLIREGRLRGDKVGRDWLVLKEAVAEYKVKAATEPLIPVLKRGRPRGKRGRKSGLQNLGIAAERAATDNE